MNTSECVVAKTLETGTGFSNGGLFTSPYCFSYVFYWVDIDAIEELIVSHGT